MLNPESTRDRLINAALRHFASGGSGRGFSLRAAAKAAGCSHVNAYHYVDGVGGLMWAAFLVATESFRAGCEKRLADVAAGDVAAFGAALAAGFLDFGLEQPGLFRLLWLESLPEPVPPGMMERIGEASAAYDAAVVAFLGP